MDAESAAWYRQAAQEVLRPLGDAEADFNAAYRGGRRTAIARACEHLGESARQSEVWSAAHPCPSSDAARHLEGLIADCRSIVECLSVSLVKPELADGRDFRVADLQHKLLWHRDVITTWAAKADE